MDFEFITPGRIVIKQGAIDEIGQYISGLGKNFLLVVDPVFYNTDTTDKILSQIKSIGAGCSVYPIPSGEPDVDEVDKAYSYAMEKKCDAVISLGGGSAIDTGKCIAMLITNGAPCLDYLEYVGKGKKVTKQPVPFVAIPTTAGTGSEVTHASVLGSKTQKFKRTVRDRKMFAKISIIDPMLTAGMPKHVTAQSGLDALAHNIESYSSWRSTPMSEAVALRGIEYGGKYLKRAYDDSGDLEARRGMCISAMCGGMALINSGVGAAHGIGMAIGIEYNVGHGEACGIALPHIMKLNAPKVPEKMDKVGEALLGKRMQCPGDGTKAAIEFMFELNESIGVHPDFKYLRIPAERLQYFSTAIMGTSLKGNPVQLEPEGWAEFLAGIL